MRKIFASLIAAAALFVACHAQTAITTDPGVNYQLLTESDIAKELKLTADQQSKVAKALSESDRALQNEIESSLVGEDIGDIEKAINAITKKHSEALRKKLATILDAAQMKRFEQIELQLSGVSVFMRDDVGKSVGLTADQKAKIKSLAAKIDEATQDMVENGIQEDVGGAVIVKLRPEDEKKLEEMNRKALAEAVRLLTADQKKKWDELAGAEFKRSK